MAFLWLALAAGAYLLLSDVKDTVGGAVWPSRKKRGPVEQLLLNTTGDSHTIVGVLYEAVVMTVMRKYHPSLACYHYREDRIEDYKRSRQLPIGDSGADGIIKNSKYLLNIKFRTDGSDGEPLSVRSFETSKKNFRGCVYIIISNQPRITKGGDTDAYMLDTNTLDQQLMIQAAEDVCNAYEQRVPGTSAQAFVAQYCNAKATGNSNDIQPLLNRCTSVRI